MLLNIHQRGQIDNMGFQLKPLPKLPAEGLVQQRLFEVVEGGKL
jgi:hypothetical protein